MSDEHQTGPDFPEFLGMIFNAIGWAFNLLKSLALPLLVVGGGLLAFNFLSNRSGQGNTANQESTPATPASDATSRTASTDGFYAPSNTPTSPKPPTKTRE